jgi:hypothetical protein
MACDLCMQEATWPPQRRQVVDIQFIAASVSHWHGLSLKQQPITAFVSVFFT